MATVSGGYLSNAHNSYKTNIEQNSGVVEKSLYDRLLLLLHHWMCLFGGNLQCFMKNYYYYNDAVGDNDDDGDSKHIEC